MFESLRYEGEKVKRMSINQRSVGKRHSRPILPKLVAQAGLDGHQELVGVPTRIYRYALYASSMYARTTSHTPILNKSMHRARHEHGRGLEPKSLSSSSAFTMRRRESRLEYGDTAPHPLRLSGALTSGLEADKGSSRHLKCRLVGAAVRTEHF